MIKSSRVKHLLLKDHYHALNGALRRANPPKKNRTCYQLDLISLMGEIHPMLALTLDIMGVVKINRWDETGFFVFLEAETSGTQL
jgi:hypothetical protein